MSPLITLYCLDLSLSGAPARFNAGTGFGGVSTKIENGRPHIARQETSPAALGSDSDNLPSAAARAAELVKESHVASAISTVQPSKNYMPQASRNAPPRPLISATRPAPGPPRPPPKNEVTPQAADLRARVKAQGPSVPQRSESFDQVRQQERQDQLRQQEQLRVQEQQRLQEEQWQRQQEEKQRQIQRQQQLQQQEQQRLLEQQQQQQSESARPLLPPSKSSPASSFPATSPAPGAAGSTTGPPPVLPLQPTKKVQIQHQEKPPKNVPTAGVAAAAAALEKPKEKEKRISTMTEVQIMEKLRQVVSEDDPKLLYSKIKKVGQG